MPTILITGANRGIGAKLAELYAADGFDVIATCRDPFSYTGPGTAMALEMTDGDSIAALTSALDGEPIDILWNNAGVYLDKGMPLSGMDWDAWEETFRVNTIAPLRLCAALMANVQASEQKKMAFTTSKMGSIAALSGGSYAYRSSKTALNMAVSILNLDVAETGIKTVMLHPGWVRTDMGTSAADIDTTTSASGMKAVVDGLTAEESGSYRNYDGSTIPW